MTDYDTGGARGPAQADDLLCSEKCLGTCVAACNTRREKTVFDVRVTLVTLLELACPVSKNTWPQSAWPEDYTMRKAHQAVPDVDPLPAALALRAVWHPRHADGHHARDLPPRPAALAAPQGGRTRLSWGLKSIASGPACGNLVRLVAISCRFLRGNLTAHLLTARAARVTLPKSLSCAAPSCMWSAAK